MRGEGSGQSGPPRRRGLIGLRGAVAVTILAASANAASAQPVRADREVRIVEDRIAQMPVLYGTCEDPLREARARALSARLRRVIDRFTRLAGPPFKLPGEIAVLDGDACTGADRFDHEVGLARRLLTEAETAMSRLERQRRMAGAAPRLRPYRVP